LKKGIVIESGNEWTVLLTPDGDFCKIPSNTNHREGKEVWFHPSSIAVNTKQRRWTPKVVTGVAGMTACILFLVLLFPLFGGPQAYAAVNIDINPSVEFEVDEDARVIHASAFNEEGRLLLKELEWEEQQVVQVALLLVQTAEQKGYMNEDRRIVISTTFYQEESVEINDKWNQMMADQLTVESTEHDYTVVLVDGRKKWHDEAKEKGIAPGDYMLSKHAEEQGVELEDKPAKEESSSPAIQPAPVKGIKIIKKSKATDEEKSKKNERDKPGKEDDQVKGKKGKSPADFNNKITPPSGSKQFVPPGLRGKFGPEKSDDDKENREDEERESRVKDTKDKNDKNNKDKDEKQGKSQNDKSERDREKDRDR
jgi:hypothetical protein